MGKKRSIKKVSAKWARSKRKQLELEKEINNNKKEGNESPPERELVVILPDSESKSGPSGQEPVQEKDKLFEVATDSTEQKVKCALSWGVKMGEKEKVYLEDQRGERKMVQGKDERPTSA